ncbi:MAG: acyltransferase [Gilliamella sp.]|uniref:acyltransferase family protein n=1 Tax=unclassified Gilliamella TaxID=2685620 RepID=UPI00080E9552|nr:MULTISPECIES: acyltransferase [Gilliamella]MCO6537439.1 acyltransferase [Gilliamella sp.]MCO6538910.1 acyltransferase [Gilliamella sp.]MCO6551147.1 acyltransferase [Gilliamella sp.]MCO6553902.1 acyltransferase [Gilliamella sp.]NUE96175.1 acyltransferase [Gilliamella sp. ESL0232]
MVTDKPQKIHSIHVLRGVAIIMIVFSHCLGVFKNTHLIANSYLFSFLNLFAFNFTTFFVLIAGFLFQHLTYKFDTKTYYLSKFKTVVCPYISVSIFCFVFFHYQYLSNLPWFSSTETSVVSSIVRMMLTGTQLLPLWFIPMIIIIYLMAPLLYFWSKKNLIVAGLIAMFWVVVFTKPDFTQPILNLLHYGPVYLIGMMIKQNYQIIIKTVKDNLFLVVFLFSLCFFVPFAYRYMSHLGVEKLYYDTLQKIVLFILALYFLDGLNHKTNEGKLYKFFSYMANISFPIYFIHEIIVLELEQLLYISPLGYVIKTDNGWLASLGAVIFLVSTLIVSVIIAKIITLVFKNKAKYLIGAIR